MLGFHADTQSEAHYLCIDTARIPGLLRILKGMVPTEVAEFSSVINKIQQSLNFLNIQFKFEAIMITTNDVATYYNLGTE